jgi:hypothetical protein
MGADNRVNIARRDTCEALGIEKRMFHRHLHSLKEKYVLTGSYRLYFVNPTFAYKGNAQQWESVLAQFDYSLELENPIARVIRTAPMEISVTKSVTP